MKTTLVLPDDLVRRAKSRAALRGQPLSGYVRDCVERSLREETGSTQSVADWLAGLPSLPKRACEDLKKALAEPDFRPIDKEMWP